MLPHHDGCLQVAIANLVLKRWPQNLILFLGVKIWARVYDTVGAAELLL